MAYMASYGHGMGFQIMGLKIESLTGYLNGISRLIVARLINGINVH